MSKLNKYFNKIKYIQKDIYLKKIFKYILEGGNGYNFKDGEQVIKYLTDIYKSRSGVNTKNKYFVILYGPPASGKTDAKNKAIELISLIENVDYTKTSLIDNFIDTNVDSITYNIKIETPDSTEKTVLTALREALYKQLYTLDKLQYTNSTVLQTDVLSKLKDSKYDDLNTIKQLIKDNENIFIENTKDLYLKNRKSADIISELLIYFSGAVNKNIFFETSNTDYKYVLDMINNLSWYGYIPLFIYPFINDANIIYDRNIFRSLEEGRLLSCVNKFGINEKIYDLLNNFKIIINKFEENKNINQYGFLMYKNIDRVEKIFPKFIPDKEVPDLTTDTNLLVLNLKYNIKDNELIKTIYTRNYKDNITLNRIFSDLENKIINCPSYVDRLLKERNINQLQILHRLDKLTPEQNRVYQEIIKVT